MGGGGSGGGAASGYNIPQPQYSGVSDATATTGITQLEQQGTGLQGLFNTYGVNTTPYEVPLPSTPVRYPLGQPNWQQGAGFGGSAGTLGTSSGGKTGTTGTGTTGTGGSIFDMIPGLSSGTGANTTGAGTVGTGTTSIPGSSSGGIDLSSLSGLANQLGALFPTYQTTLGPGGQTSGGLVNLLQPTNYTSQQGVNAGNAVQASVLGLPNLASSLTGNMGAGNTLFNQQQPAFNNAVAGVNSAAQGIQQQMPGVMAGMQSSAQNLTGLGNEINAMVPAAQTNANAMSAYIPQALAQGFDPNQALYTQGLQATTDAAAAQEAASGTAASPFGAMATGRAVSEFENAWNQQQVGLESTAAGTANTLAQGQALPASIASQAGTQYGQAGSLYGQEGQLVNQTGSTLGGLYGQIPTMQTQNQQNQLTAQQSTAAVAGTIESLLSQFSSGMLGGSDTAQNSANNVLNALSGLTGVGNQASAQQQMAVGDSISYLQTAIQAAEALTQAQQAQQQMGQQSAGQMGSALGSIGGMMGGK